MISYFEDHFTGTNNTDLINHTPDSGGQWISWLGSAVLDSGFAKTTGSRIIYTLHLNLADCEISAKIKCGTATGNNAPSIVFRGTGTNNYNYVYFSGDGVLAIYQYTGSYVNKASTTWSADTNWHDVIVKCESSTITVTIDGGTPWVVENYTQTYVGTYCGITGWTYSGTADSWDDFIVQGEADPGFPGANSLLFSDNFNAANDTRLNTRGWAEENGTWTVQSNKAENAYVAQLPLSGYITSYNAVKTDFALEVKITTPATGQVITGLAFRFSDLNHFLEVELNSAPSWNGFSGFGCWYFNGTIFTQIMCNYFQPQNGTTYTLRVQLIGNIIIAELVEPGIKLIGSSSIYTGNTKVGIFDTRDQNRPNSCTYDDFNLYTPSGSASASPSGSISPSVSRSVSQSSSISPSISSSFSISSSISPSISQSRSISPSSSISPSISQSSSISPSISSSTSQSTSVSPSFSVSPSVSPSVSKSISASLSPSFSISASQSISSSTSPSISPSGSFSPSSSPSSGIYGGILKRWDGANWVKEPLKVYLGSWQTKILKVYLAGIWQEVDISGV